MTFLSLNWRSKRSFEKGHLNIAKKGRKELPGTLFIIHHHHHHHHQLLSPQNNQQQHDVLKNMPLQMGTHPRHGFLGSVDLFMFYSFFSHPSSLPRLGSSKLQTYPRWWFQIFFYVHPYLGKIPILTNIFQMGWSYQLENPQVDNGTFWMDYTHFLMAFQVW